MDLHEHDAAYVIDCIRNGKAIPLEYKYALFPVTQKEYELTYAGKMRKEDVLADNEEAKAVPLQIEKRFSGSTHTLLAGEWQNMLIFGDNLQILKTIYKNQDELIKDKIKGRVRLIYIDPPFASEAEYSGSSGQKAYTDKTKGAEFVEYLRRRLIVARELLAEDGSIYVHLDWKKGHYIKVLLDEIFGENNFRNEIVWHYDDKFATGGKSLDKNHDTIYHYSKTTEFVGNEVRIAKEKTTKRALRKKVEGKTVSLLDESGNKIYEEYSDKSVDDVWDIGRTIGKNESSGYPTQKKEALLERIIRYGSDAGDLVMDFFSGSGTTLAVAEKLGRRWVGCDIGKFSIYTIQKRLLEIDKSQDLDVPSQRYQQPARAFDVIASGLYDLGGVFALKRDAYSIFVKGLFEVQDVESRTINGIDIDGKKREFYVKIFPYWELEGASVDEAYIEELHRHIGSRIGDRFYIIAPANNVDFISDYYEIAGKRYYFLKVPYQIIKELHRVQFKKLRQPQSKKSINDLDEAIGFHFVRQPEVHSEVVTVRGGSILKITEFRSAYSQDETGEKLENFESLAMLLFDYQYDGSEFIMDKYFFADDLMTTDPDDEEAEMEEQLRSELSKRKSLDVVLPSAAKNGQTMVIYIDIYGNEFREVIKV